MSLFGKIFGDKKEESDSSLPIWKLIESENDLTKAIETSENKTVAIFKHSTRCFISKTVLKNFEAELRENENAEAEFYFLDLIAYRAISNKIADDFGVRHESPQLLVLENGSVKNSASHQDISISQITA
ncbi:bacillithiol system redox-active protein YtxJ [Chryseobacterium caseinilyticum]|uniref:Bacillithiol system redox-active protein YtxJ n=1 Tax=Chryseobacterium caseinilyticum TaxID=2771428 RepID=A0ABR8Z8U6_9FLAO|nr:bacillithiol system redox-active protein YtxJ [Chryseobacterium caseinilyticum]MBD8081729.1 bacillithiol system redox-active protein YtxJ [Chryseobacterium caseinilyticum]